MGEGTGKDLLVHENERVGLGPPLVLNRSLEAQTLDPECIQLMRTVSERREKHSTTSSGIAYGRERSPSSLLLPSMECHYRHPFRF